MNISSVAIEEGRNEYKLEPDKLFTDVYNSILRYFGNYQKYYSLLKSQLKLKNDPSYRVYTILHIDIVLVLESVIKFRKFTDTDTVRDICEYIYENIKKKLHEKYNSISHDNEDKKIIDQLWEEYSNKSVDLKRIVSSVISKIKNMYSDMGQDYKINHARKPYFFRVWMNCVDKIVEHN